MGVWPLGDGMVELCEMVAILGFSRAPAIRFATDTTRATSFRTLASCLDDLGGVTREILTDRDPCAVKHLASSQAAGSYSWMSPPSRSVRTILFSRTGGRDRTLGGSGSSCPSPW